VAAAKEDDMNPVLMQALAAERIRENQAQFSAAGRARRAERSLSVRLFARSPRAGRGPVILTAARSLRSARPA
jgi:predicted outer membrane protein